MARQYTKEEKVQILKNVYDIMEKSTVSSAKNFYENSYMAKLEKSTVDSIEKSNQILKSYVGSDKIKMSGRKTCINKFADTLSDDDASKIELNVNRYKTTFEYSKIYQARGQKEMEKTYFKSALSCLTNLVQFMPKVEKNILRQRKRPLQNTNQPAVQAQQKTDQVVEPNIQQNKQTTKQVSQNVGQAVESTTRNANQVPNKLPQINDSLVQNRDQINEPNRSAIQEFRDRLDDVDRVILQKIAETHKKMVEAFNRLKNKLQNLRISNILRRNRESRGERGR